MKDYIYWNEYHDVSEGSGRSEKIWLQNPDSGQVGLFKFKKDINTTDHISEKMAYELSLLINMPCAKFDIGIYQGREGSISYNIRKNEQEVLQEGIYYINQIYPGYDPECFYDRDTKYYYSLEMIFESLKEYDLDGEFLKIPIFDFLIGNTDRHQNNWAIMITDGLRRISPLYDNSSSLCAYEHSLEQYLGKDKLKWKALIDTKSRSIIRISKKDKIRPKHTEVLNYIYNNYYQITKGFVDEIISNITYESTLDILNKYNDTHLSVTKKEVLHKFLIDKLKLLKEIYAGKGK